MKNHTSSAAGAPAGLASANHSARRPRWLRLLSGTLVTVSIFMLVMNMGYGLVRFVTFRYWLIFCTVDLSSRYAARIG